MHFTGAVQSGSTSSTQDLQVLDLTSLRSSRFAINRSLQPGCCIFFDRYFCGEVPSGLQACADFAPRHFVIKNQDADAEDLILDLAP